MRQGVAVDQDPVVAEAKALQEALLAADRRHLVALAGVEAVPALGVVQRQRLQAAAVPLAAAPGAPYMASSAGE